MTFRSIAFKPLVLFESHKICWAEIEIHFWSWTNCLISIKYIYRISLSPILTFESNKIWAENNFFHYSIYCSYKPSHMADCNWLLGRYTSIRTQFNSSRANWTKLIWCKCPRFFLEGSKPGFANPSSWISPWRNTSLPVSVWIVVRLEMDHFLPGQSSAHRHISHLLYPAGREIWRKKRKKSWDLLYDEV